MSQYPHAVAWIVMALAVAAGLAAGQAVVASQNATADSALPLTPWGDPDLQGIYDVDGNPPLERPAEFGDRALLTDEEIAEREAAAAAQHEQVVTGAENRSAVDPRAASQGEPIRFREYNQFWTAGTDARRIPRRTSMIIDPPDGQLPALTPAALARLVAREAARRGRGEADTWEDRNPWERCTHNGGLPLSMYQGVGPYRQIIQTPDYVMILMEMMHDFRLIPLDGRAHVPPAVRMVQGDGRGRWEGNTLVVETANLAGNLDGGPVMPSRLPFRHYLGSGAGLSLTERFTRIDAGTLEYQYTVDDPTVFVRPYTAVVHLHKDDTQRQIHEYACHEGNYGMLNSLSGGRAQEGLYLSEAARQAGEREAFYVRQREKLAAWQASQGDAGR